MPEGLRRLPLNAGPGRAPDLPSPLWESSRPAPSGSRTLLLISPHFPPGAAAGALRWQRLATYAPRHGWRLDVITFDPSELEAVEWERLDELPPGTRVWGLPAPPPRFDRLVSRVWFAWRRWRLAAGGRGEATPSWETPGGAESEAAGRPTSLHRDELRWPGRRARDWVRAYNAVVDCARDGGWARRAARLGRAIAAGAPPAAVVSCGPPHMAHEGARHLASCLRVPLVLDLRDPWSLLQRLPEPIASPLWLRLAQRYERRCVEAARLVVMNTEPAREAMQRRYPDARERILAIPNGCDDPGPIRGRREARFLLLYAGTIYLDRDPRPLLDALARLVREEALRPQEIGIEFVGDVARFGSTPLEAMARAAGIERFVTVVARLPRRELLERMARAAMLVVLPQDSDLAIPSKLYEYMGFEAWILALAAPGSAVARLLAGSPADVVAPTDAEGLVAVLRKRLSEHRAGVRPPRLAADERFGRRRQAERLFEALERCLGSPAAGAGAGPETAPVGGRGGGSA